MHANAYECMAVESPSNKSTDKRTKIASFNVRGLTDPNKQHHLTKDLARYKIDICCLQETKVSELSDTNNMARPTTRCNNRRKSPNLQPNRLYSNTAPPIQPCYQRSFSGTITESDHRLLVTTTNTKPAYKRIFGPNSLP